MAHWLSVIKGDEAGKRFCLAPGQGTLGRAPSNHVQLLDSEVSRVHCRYHLVGDSLEIADLDSANGTFVNHVSIERRKLQLGDRIHIGTSVLEYQADDNSVADAATEDVPTTEPTGSLSYLPISQAIFADCPDQAGSDFSKTEFAQRLVQVGTDLNFMYHASLVTSRKGTSADMLERVVGLIIDWVAADRCCVLMLDKDTSVMEIKSFRARSESVSGDKPLLSQSIVNHVRQNRVAVLTSDAVEDQRFASEERMKSIGIQEAMCVPIQGRGEILGVIYVDTIAPTEAAARKRFSEDHLKLMTAIAHQMAFAIENETFFADLPKQKRLTAIGQTTATLSHRIKNVLQGVNGGSHLVNEGLRDGNLEMVKAGWQIVDRNQTVVSKLINDMLILGQTYQPNLVMGDLNGVISEVLEEVAPDLLRWNVQCDWSPVPDLEAFRFDPRGIHCAIFNVINSCGAACREMTNGKIRIWLDRSINGTLTINVANNGPPASVENPEDLFSPTKKALDHSMNPVELTVSRKLFRGHGGDVSIQHPETGGNVFVLRLPLAPISP